MKLVRKTAALCLAFLLIWTSMTGITSALANAASAPEVTELQNDFIKVTVDNATGRFGIRTIEGQPIRKKDQNVNLLFGGDDPETSFTTFRIDGTDYIFGNPYKFAPGFFSEITEPRIVNNTNGTKQIETVWSIKGVYIKQIIMLYASASDKKNAGNVNVRYEVNNRSGAQVELGSRILLDTMVAGNDGPQFQIGTAYKAPLTVERTLVHDPENNPDISEEDRAYYKIPPYWVMRDKLDLTNPLATNVIAYGFNNFAENNVHIVDKMIVGHWNGLANTKWDYKPNGNLDFTRDTNDYGSADSAVAFYWEPEALPNQGVQSFETVYGLGEIIEPDKIFSIRYMDPVQQLATLEDGSAYVDEGVFDITAEIENLDMFHMEHTNIEVEMTLESGLSFVKLDEKGGIVRTPDGKVATEAYRSKKLEFRKTATPEEAAQGIKPKYKPGDYVTASYKVLAKGRPWPTTKEYILTAKSPETQAKLDGVEDEGIKAQYESSKANFILLPPVGQAAATYAYGMSPKELYSSDVKYVTVNLTNIDAYNTGNQNGDPNFDLYLRNKMSGERYKVPVKSSVILQPTDDGFSGDMRITYRGGALVDSTGKVIQDGLGPELPLGEYQVEIDYKGDTGGDEDIAALYDITTAQTFLVTDNEESRIREAGILAIYKQMVDLSHAPISLNGKLLEEINEAYPREPFKAGTDLFSVVTAYKDLKQYVGMASKAVDPNFDLSEYLGEEALAETPAYNYRMFASDEEMEEFFEDEDREQLVVVRGMIKEVGTGNDMQVIVDTKTEPAIINDSVAYKGKDMVFVRGKLDLFGSQQRMNGYTIPFFDTLFVKGDGKLSVANSGFVFHQGEWTLDFFNGFDKSLGEGYVIENETFPDSGDNEEDDSLNGSISWAVGSLGDRLNPMRQLMIPHVYFNKHSLFAPPNFIFSGFGFSFNDFILREGGISFGGKISMKVVEAEVRNVIFNDKGFVGVDAGLKFDLNEELGLFEPKDKKPEGEAEKEDGPKKPSGEINIVHYVQPVEGVSNRYGLKFDAQLKNMLEIKAELSLKKVDDGRILPDVIAFGTTLGKPGVLVTGATYLTAVRGAVRELADTIAGGTKDDPFPLVIQAGVSTRFGIAPAYHFGDIDLTLKRTGIALQGKMDFSTVPEPEDGQLMEMISMALLEAQWVTPWFVRVEAEVNIGGWNIIMGKAGIFVGQNLEKKRTDFEGYIGARLQIPNDVPVVGGMPLSSVFLGVNNDKLWGSIGILFISLGITYYWGGGVEFGTSDENLPDGLVHLLIEDPERGPKLLVIGQGMQTVATSWIDSEQASHEIEYHKVDEGMSVMSSGVMSAGIGGITSKNSGRVHEIPMTGVSGNAIVEVEYTENDVPALAMKDASGMSYPIVFDNTNTNPSANAFTQFLPASSNEKDQVDVRKAYIIIPHEQTKKGGNWTLTSASSIETRLMNIPMAPKLKDVRLEKSSSNVNEFQASWTVDNAKPGDKINLFLAKDAVTNDTTKLENGQDVLQPGDPGLLIAKDVAVGEATGGAASGSITIDVTNVELLGGKEDIRGLLQQGDYYLRAELKSDNTFDTKTSAEKFEIIDPLAPQEVSDVEIEPAGNGLFALSFKPSPKKAGQEQFEHSYKIEALQERDGRLDIYRNFGDTLLTEKELEKNWNPATGKYEGILVGGWTAMSTSNEIHTNSLEGQTVDTENVKYTGLQVGQEYVLGVSATVKATKEADKNENYHFAARADSVKKLLPIPVKPSLSASKEGPYASHMEVLTNQAKQSIELFSDQQDMELEAFYSDQSLGKVSFVNEDGGSRGTLELDKFDVDGPYAIELKARNKKTKDMSLTMLYLTVDKIAPTLYIDEPLTGQRTSSGKVQVAGKTSNDASVTIQEAVMKDGQKQVVKETPLTVSDNGSFQGQVELVSAASPESELTFVARDKAGNGNKAVVSVTNDQFEVPVALVLKKMDSLEPGEQKAIEASLRYPDGKDAAGKPKFKELPLSAEDRSKLSFTVYAGDTVKLDNEQVLATAEGSNIIQAEYHVSDNVTLQSMMVVSAAGRMESITAHTEQIIGKRGITKVVVTAAGDMTDQELAYKVFSQNTAVTMPTYKQSLIDWNVLPNNGEVAAVSGDTVVVAKRTVDRSKQAMAVISKPLTANVFKGSSGGGGGGGFISLPVGSEGVTVNDKSLIVDKVNNKVTALVTAKDVEAAGSGDITIASQDGTVESFTFRVEQEAMKQLVAANKSIILNVPLAKLVITPDMIAGMDRELEIMIGRNSDDAKQALRDMAVEVEGTLLAEGEGVSLETNIPAVNQHSYLRVTVPVYADGMTAVVLRDPNGQWTTLPWKQASAAGQQTYADVKWTGQGNLMFIRSSKSFGDVEDGFWGKTSIDQASGKLFVLGRSDGKFEPDSKVTRAEYPTMLLRVAGMMNKKADANFADVEKADWYYRSVAVAAQLGIVNGFGDGSYGPDATLSRVEAMTMIGRMLDVLGLSNDIGDEEVNRILEAYSDDESIPDWARKPVALSIKNGIIEGENGVIHPNDALTRSQAAAIAVRLDRWIMEH
ncbi:hypothetical protein DVH26_29935 [Paenibacillus sp. H1-7]|uniref:S-layer homology domain-containing protein n=1 Tax=Paenibacillus sp. H1-7 TaxID=2282849 RepID=UPI001EF99063|nr:S-layer homology domain-containing protein [Paenibacillus sp. H1-7]ULL18313.1 hypothetical protein DVH26_29935 [Paenibacillus sp. H1-7]